MFKAKIPAISRLFSSKTIGSLRSAAPSTTTGIEHSLEHNRRGKQSPGNFEKEYKCIDYLNFNPTSYYDKEMELQRYRCAQPNPKKPDTEPRVRTQSSS